MNQPYFNVFIDYTRYLDNPTYRLKAPISKFNTLALKSLLKMLIIFGLFRLIHTLMKNIAVYMT